MIGWLQEWHKLQDADTLILLSDVDGLYTKNPKLFKDC